MGAYAARLKIHGPGYTPGGEKYGYFREITTFFPHAQTKNHRPRRGQYRKHSNVLNHRPQAGGTILHCRAYCAQPRIYGFGTGIWRLCGAGENPNQLLARNAEILVISRGPGEAPMRRGKKR